MPAWFGDWGRLFRVDSPSPKCYHSGYMTVEQSWKIIEEVHRDSSGDMDRKCELLHEQLARLPDDELQAFSRFFQECHNRAYDWGLWGAAYIIRGGCSDDKFSDFRANLISYGREAFEKTLTDPDSLVDLPGIEDAASYEGYDFVIYGAERSRLPDSLPFPPGSAEPSGEDWDENDDEALAVRFPRLSGRFSRAYHRAKIAASATPWWKFW